MHAATVIGSLLVASCGAGSGREHVVHRFVDPELRIGAESRPPSLVTSRPAGRDLASTQAIPIATLSNDTRYVLASAPRPAILAIGPPTFYETPNVEIPARARLTFAIGVGEQVGTGRVGFRVSPT